jgi:ribonuclease HII
MLVGIDEAGRGPVLGPLVIGICCIPDDAEALLVSKGVKDSKHLSSKKRQELEKWFHQQPAEGGWFGTTVSIDTETIDLALQDQGLNWLEVDGFREAIMELPHQTDLRIVADACDVNAERFTQRITEGISEWPWKECNMVSEHKADEHHPVVSMASILAKEE